MTDYPPPRCPLCNSGPYYGDDPEAPVWYDCGSGHMTAENLPEKFMESTACGMIRRLDARIKELIKYASYCCLNSRKTVCGVCSVEACSEHDMAGSWILCNSCSEEACLD